MELSESRTYNLLPGRKLAVYTWYGAEVHVSGSISAAYKSDETTMPLIANLHQRLEARREEARNTGGQGPRILVAGPTDSGKSTLCRTLCAYACRVGRCPTFVDLDLGQGDLSVPGTLVATPLDRGCLTVEEGYGLATPLAYYYAHTSAHDTVPVYKNYAQRLADTVNRRVAADEAARVSGLIVNTMGWIDAAGYPLLLDIIRIFSIDVVVVMGHDRLFAQLIEDVKKIDFAVLSPPVAAAPASSSSSSSVAASAADGGAESSSASTGPAAAGAASSSSSSSSASSSAAAASTLKQVSVVKLARSGGVVARDQSVRKNARKSRFKEYFYGQDKGPGTPAALSPEVITVKFDDITVVRVGGASSDASLVPVGKSSALDPLRVAAIQPSPSLMNHVLGVSFAANDKQIPHVNVAGFVHVRGVNMEARTLTLLVPCAGPLPSRFLLMGTNTWIEA